MSLVRGIVSAELENAYDEGWKAFCQEAYTDTPQFCPYQDNSESWMYWHYGYNYAKMRKWDSRAKMREWYRKKHG